MYRQLKKNLSPVLHTSCPLPHDIHRRQIGHFQQRFIGWKDTFCHFSQLTMAALDPIRRVNQLA
jgi:hypothetical protein